MATQDISQLVVEVKSTGIKTATRDLEALAKASDKAETAVKKLGTSVVGANGALSGGVAQTAALVAAMTTLTAVMNRMSQTQQRTTTSQRQNNEAMREAHALARGLSGSLGALWVTYGNLAGMGIGIALGASLKGVVTVGKEVEHTLEQIRVLGQATTEDVGKMSAMISELGKGSQGPQEVAKAFQVLTLAGLKAKDSMDGVQAALNLSLAGDIGIEKSAETLVQVGTSLGYTAKSYDAIGDMIAKTAAVSMSSVESISGAFKSASAVGEVYGASLQDIALGLAAVANLGIGFSAAGTALKNFYKDLSASTQKVTSTMQAMGLTIADFRDSQGYMMPLLDVVEKLDAGFNKLNPKARKLAEVKMFSQQGTREFAILQKLLHTASDQFDELGNKYKSKLHEMNDEIKKSAAFATLAAIAMSQTTSNQISSVFNTVKTVFKDVFTEVSPAIGSVARSMKEAFASKEFKEGLTALATGVANLTKFVVENAGAVLELAAAWWGAMKLAALVPAMNAAVVAAGGLGAAITAAGAAFRAGAAGAALFNLALGPIGITIAALTAAWVLYKSKQDDALNNDNNLANLQEYNDKVVEAATKEARMLKMRKEGKTAEQIARAEQMEEDGKAADKALKMSQAGVAAMEKETAAKRDALSWAEKLMIERLKGGEKTAFVTNKIKDYMESEQKLADAQGRHANAAKITKIATEALTKARRENFDMDEKERKANRFISPGTGELPGKGDKAGDNAKYAADIAVFTNLMKAAHQEMDNVRESANLDFKAGKIGQLQLINTVADQEVESYGAIAKAARDAMEVAGKKKNGGADVERFKGEAERAEADARQADKARNERFLVAERQAHAESVNMQVKALEAKGKFKEAAELKWAEEGKVQWAQAQADAEAYGAVYPWLIDRANAFKQAQEDAVASGTLRDAMLSFDVAILETSETLKGFKADTFGKSLGSMFDSASAATEQYAEKLEKARAEYNKLQKIAADPVTGTDKAKKEAAKAGAELKAVADKQKTMWKEVGETISSSLENAFGDAGKAMGGIVTTLMEIKNTENATAEDRMSQYGNMATAASGFFDKQSKGYKALNGIAQVFHVASMARTLAQTAASVAAGAAQFFAQSGWGGFAGVAAMGAVLAGLGYAASGGLSSSKGGKTAEEMQKEQGTGGVFGDAKAKSDSINKSIEDLKNNSNVMLPVNQAMLASLRGIEAAMGGLTNLVARTTGMTNGTNMGVQTGKLGGNGMNFVQNTLMGTNALGGAAAGFMLGGPIGAVLGAVVGKVLGKFWGSTKQNIVDSGLQFGGRVSDMQAGQGFNQYASVDTTKKSWFGAKKKTTNSIQTQGLNDELSSQFGLIFTNLEDTLKIAGGAFGKTASEVQSTIDNLVIQTSSISLKDLKGDELEAAINGVISKTMDEIASAALPGLDKFRQVGEGYAQTAIRVAGGIESANFAMEQLNIKAVKYTDVVNKQGDVAAEIAKQSILAHEGLNGVSDMLKNMGGSMEDLVSAYKALDAIRNQMNLTGLNGGKLDVNTVKGAGGVSQLQAALGSYQDKYFTEQEKAGIMLKSVTGEFKKLNVTLPANKAALRALIEQTSKSNPELTGQLLALADSYDKTIEAATNARKESDNGLQDTIDGLKAFADALKEFKDSLALGDMSILTPTEKYYEAKRQYEETVSKAMAGDQAAKDAYTGVAQAYLDASRTVNASSQGYTDSYNKVMADIEKLGTSNAGELSNAEKQLEALNKEVSLLEMLNDTAFAIQSSISTLAPPVVSSTTVSVDTAALEAQIADLKKQMAEADARHEKKMNDLMAVTFDSNTAVGSGVAAVIEKAVDSAIYYSRRSNTHEDER